MPTQWQIVVLSVVLCQVAGCALHATGDGSTLPFVRRAHVNEPMLTCSEATHAAGEAVTHMGYIVATVEAAKPGEPGKVVGTRDSGWMLKYPEPGTLYTATVTILCGDWGAEINAVTDEGVITQLGFPARFAAAMKETVDPKAVPRRRDEPEQGLEIRVEPQRASAARGEFGADLPAAGLTPVRVEIINRSSRRYDFRRDAVELVTVQGDRQTALPLPAATQLIQALRDASQVARLLEDKQIANAEIPPGASVSGYLYFNASAYQRARVVLTDVESQEADGFSVEF